MVTKKEGSGVRLPDVESLGSLFLTLKSWAGQLTSLIEF